MTAKPQAIQRLKNAYATITFKSDGRRIEYGTLSNSATGIDQDGITGMDLTAKKLS
jgi:hypothetical protein